MDHFSSRRLNPLPDDDCLMQKTPKIADTVAASSWPHSTQWEKQGRRPLGTSEQGRYPAADPAMDSTEGCAGDDCECSLTVTHAGYFWLVYTIVCAAAVAAVFA